MLLRRIKAEGVLEVIHHALDICIGAPCQNLVFGIGLFDTLEIPS